MILHKESKVTIIRSTEGNRITVYKNGHNKTRYKPLTQQLIHDCVLSLSKSGILIVTGNRVNYECFIDSFQHKTPELFTEDSLKKDGKTIEKGWATYKKKELFKLVTSSFSIVYGNIEGHDK